METDRLIDGMIAFLTEIERSPDRSAWCRQYSVYASMDENAALLRDIWDWTDRVYAAGIVISNYHAVIERWGLDECEIRQADPVWLERQPYLCVLAGIAWHFRRDHFSEGSLIRSSIAEGALLRLFQRLRTLCPTLAPAVTLHELWNSACACIPEAPGVYWVLAPEGMPVVFGERQDDSGLQGYPAVLLREKWAGCIDRGTLYIGKAAGRRGLRQRLRQYMAFGQGQGKNHKGGRAIWQIENPGLLLLAYEVCAEPDTREHQLLREYRERNGSYPVANWRG